MIDIALEVDMQHSDSDIHTKRILLTAAQEDVAPTTSTKLSKPVHTQTSVEIVTAALPEDDVSSESSLSPQHTVSVPHGVLPNSPHATAKLPEDDALSTYSLSPHSVPHGVVPGSPRALEPASAHSSKTTTSTDDLETKTSTDCWEATTSSYGLETATATARRVARRSTYPRPSPPGFLYPEAIVPRSVYESEMQHPDMPGMGRGSGLW
jgi:hypothetical protein